MPRGPKGEKRPADVIGAAVMIGKIATGEIEDITTEDGKNAAAVAHYPNLGHLVLRFARPLGILQKLRHRTALVLLVRGTPCAALAPPRCSRRALLPRPGYSRAFTPLAGRPQATQ